jgi:hypothetical protein
MKKMLQRAAVLLLLSALDLHFSNVFAQGTAFTYQGRLNANGAVAGGLYDFRFRLDADPAGNTILNTMFTNAIGVTNGLFTTTIDFGPGWFAGSNYWLEVDVRTNTAANYTTLTPFQSLTPTPYAVFANTASNVSGTVSAAQLTGAVPAASLAGTYGNAIVLSNANNSFAGNGASVLNVNAAALNGLSAASFWQLGGNNVAGGQFLGSTNNQPVELWANGSRAFRLEPNSGGAPNVIGGSPVNYVAGGVTGATISGGGQNGLTNRVGGSGGVIGGGFNNTVGTFNGTVSGGQNNTAGGNASVVGGGSENSAGSDHALVAGGQGNSAGGPDSVVSGGSGNSANANHASISGGAGNVVDAFSEYSLISGGGGNLVQSSGYSSIGGGSQNNISDPSFSDVYDVIAGGQNNFETNVQNSFIGGGQNNSDYTSYSVIGGGVGNTLQIYARYSVIGGGQGNMVYSNSDHSFLGGGLSNSIQSAANESVLAGGLNNFIGSGSIQTVVSGGQFNTNNANQSVIGGGTANTILTGSWGSVIGGGQQISIGTNSDHSFIGGGWVNIMGQNDYEGVIAGGYVNSMGGFSGYSAIGGGQGNVIGNNSPNSAIPGGANNLIGTNAADAFAAGQQAQAVNQGAFVWADSQNAPFASTANDQFLIRAQGGVGINMNNNPGNLQPASLYVQGANSNGWPNSVVYFQNTASSTNNAPALRVINTSANATNTDGALSVSIEGQGLIAEFGNSGTFPVVITNDGTVYATAFVGNGSALASLNASQISSGTVPLAQLPPAVVTNSETGVTLSGTFTGNGGGLTNLNAAQLTGGINNTIFVGPAGNSASTGSDDTAAGFNALNGNTIGSHDTAVGYEALNHNTTGADNTANGNAALFSNTNGAQNTANGSLALEFNTSGSGNLAEGYRALEQNTNGSFNVASGAGALVGLKNGSNNIALGYYAANNFAGNESGNIDIGNGGTLGDQNIIRIGSGQTQTYIAGVINGNGSGLTSLTSANLIGALPAISGANLTALNASQLTSGTVPLTQLPAGVLTNNETTAVTLNGVYLHSDGNDNFFAGPSSGGNATGPGFNNTAIGYSTLFNNLGGGGNTAVGSQAFLNNHTGNENTAVGYQTLLLSQQGHYNLAIGYQAGDALTTGSSNIYVGSPGVATEYNTVRIGTPGIHTNAVIAGVVTATGGLQVGAGGTAITFMQSGQAIMNSASTQETNFTIAFPTAFTSAPKIIFSVANDPGFQGVSDVFASSISSNSPAAFAINVYRLNGTGWSQNLRVNWQAWQ